MNQFVGIYKPRLKINNSVCVEYTFNKLLGNSKNSIVRNLKFVIHTLVRSQSWEEPNRFL